MRAVLTGVLVNASLAIVKIISGVVGNSYALIADGIESTLDIFSTTVVWGGLQIAARPPDANHPFGHGKAEPLAALVVALGLLGAALGLVIQSIREILTPHHAPAPFTLLVLLLVVASKELLFRFVLRVGEAINSTAVRSDAWHHRSDVLTSLAAFIGIAIALFGGPGYESADDWATLLACAVIGGNGVRLLRQAVREVMDTAPAPALAAKIREVSKSVPGVLAVEKCRVRKSGLTYQVDIHIVVDGEATVRHGHEIAHAVKHHLCAAGLDIFDVNVHVEPGSVAAG
ncbi:MAG: cation diffusion facilitator family transporter [candidate division KSB1 bacterium]|nr:cation diffusion facilitator family transporter [candidate division KSB1 bacterium]MDZ7273189.1 cation diffusion facilitator family transporter [candidate division KSB1 bacterium]MDZ7285291.1 cation diffusion facilitator family transporter [candidate division KSB1 bacterium]MDZ7298323.1 cation diffusion facilitator family transporter [candidate division KSB1 bacterium]MDZ7349044.1 cation diffusion facilitator family transporter [candidate division KSB1 bacterium]